MSELGEHLKIFGTPMQCCRAISVRELLRLAPASHWLLACSICTYLQCLYCLHILCHKIPDDKLSLLSTPDRNVVDKPVWNCRMSCVRQWRSHFRLGTFNFRSACAAEAGVFCSQHRASTSHFETIIHNAAVSAAAAAAATARINPSWTVL